jgi:single-strand DNA-binding protein
MFQQMIVVGNLGQEPELRYTPSGVPVLNLSVATNRRWKDAEGITHERTTWFRVTVWREQAEWLAARNLKQGQQVMALGEIEQPSVYTDREGNHRAALELTARTVRVLGPKEQETTPQQMANLDDVESIPW